jgi:glycogen debranching enzyme
MSINTGLLALCAARYGQMDDALDIIARLTRAFGYRTPGAVSEALPDAWCFLQLWSNVGLVAPVVECFLGIQPHAAQRRLAIRPHLPSAWSWAEVKHLRVGDACFDIRAERAGESYHVEVTSDSKGWEII